MRNQTITTVTTIKEARQIAHRWQPNGDIVFVSPTGRVIAHYICDGASGYSFFTKGVPSLRRSVNGRLVHHKIVEHWEFKKGANRVLEGVLK